MTDFNLETETVKHSHMSTIHVLQRALNTELTSVVILYKKEILELESIRDRLVAEYQRSFKK